MTTTIGELISQIRNQTKSVNQDNLYLSDRLIFSLCKKHAALFLYREDTNMKLTSMRFLYTPIVRELIEVDKVEANCLGLRSDCTFKRTKDPLPTAFKGYSMPLIGEVTSVDQSFFLQPTTAASYVRKMNATEARYNKTQYFWYMSKHLYFPNIEWDAIRIELILDDDVDECGDIDLCSPAQDMSLSIPEYLLSSIVAEVLKDLSILLQITTDSITDKQSPLR